MEGEVKVAYLRWAKNWHELSLYRSDADAEWCEQRMYVFLFKWAGWEE